MSKASIAGLARSRRSAPKARVHEVKDCAGSTAGQWLAFESIIFFRGARSGRDFGGLRRNCFALAAAKDQNIGEAAHTADVLTIAGSFIRSGPCDHQRTKA